MTWTGKINGVTNPAKINGIAVANIKSVNGVGFWLNYTDNSYWRCLANCTAWNGSVWTEAGPGMSLQLATDCDWHLGFRPTKLRVTYSGAGPAQITLYYSGGSNSDASYTSGDEIDLTITGDIYRINLYTTVTVSAIEFDG